jgi:hypothetical protein
MEQNVNLVVYSHISDLGYGYRMWEYRLNLPILQQVYDINRDILQYTVSSTVFNIQDVFTPLPEGTNRFVYIWGLLIF